MSILIPTHNRAAVLTETLEALTRVETRDLAVEWIIIDNNSTDSTPEVVKRFENRLPVSYLFEPRPGKNCALNKAICECDLGDIVVFADDDITPTGDWLVQIVEACSRFPNCAVFGGRIIPRYPSGRPPSWAEDRFIQMFAFSLHDYGTFIKEYSKGTYPFGPNFWIRKEIVDSGFRYDERIGPRPTHRIMGSESRFLQTLEKAGYPMLYYPDVMVEHRIQATECTPAAVRRRAIRLGRGEIYLSGLPRPALREKSRFIWIGYLLLKLLYASVLWGWAFFSMSERKRLEHTVSALRIMGNGLESLRVGRSTFVTEGVESDPSRANAR